MAKCSVAPGGALGREGALVNKLEKPNHSLAQSTVLPVLTSQFRPQLCATCRDAG